jgi:hypothetical protein
MVVPSSILDRGITYNFIQKPPIDSKNILNSCDIVYDYPLSSSLAAYRVAFIGIEPGFYDPDLGFYELRDWQEKLNILWTYIVQNKIVGAQLQNFLEVAAELFKQIDTYSINKEMHKYRLSSSEDTAEITLFFENRIHSFLFWCSESYLEVLQKTLHLENQIGFLKSTDIYHCSCYPNTHVSNNSSVIAFASLKIFKAPKNASSKLLHDPKKKKIYYHAFLANAYNAKTDEYEKIQRTKAFEDWKGADEDPENMMPTWGVFSEHSLAGSDSFYDEIFEHALVSKKSLISFLFYDDLTVTSKRIG